MSSPGTSAAALRGFAVQESPPTEKATNASTLATRMTVQCIRTKLVATSVAYQLRGADDSVTNAGQLLWPVGRDDFDDTEFVPWPSELYGSVLLQKAHVCD